MMPTILVAFILGLIRSLEAFEIELILGRPIGLHVFSTKIYSFMTIEPPQFAPASALGSFFLIVLGLLVALQRVFLRQRTYTTISGRGFSARAIRLGPLALCGARFRCRHRSLHHGGAHRFAFFRDLYEALRLFLYSRALDIG
jgi:ABC-type Fe3+ transport system permease subunit